MHTHKLLYTHNGMTRAMVTDEIISTNISIQVCNSFFRIRVRRGLFCFATLKIENSRLPVPRISLPHSFTSFFQILSALIILLSLSG